MTVYYNCINRATDEATTVWTNLVNSFDLMDGPNWIDEMLDKITDELALFNGKHILTESIFEFGTEQDKFAFLLKWS